MGLHSQTTAASHLMYRGKIPRWTSRKTKSMAGRKPKSPSRLGYSKDRSVTGRKPQRPSELGYSKNQKTFKSSHADPAPDVTQKVLPSSLKAALFDKILAPMCKRCGHSNLVHNVYQFRMAKPRATLYPSKTPQLRKIRVKRDG